ncbi:MAG TPA: HAMP domain-containing sensor histidine kinase [Vicinamibacterales bacterium]|nr:HAMP domain-containing sensor histidine kinase [Vicinamibacterales bacterium]
MEAGPLITTSSASRAVYAAGLLTALLAVLLGAWFFTGWHDVRLRQHEARQTPHVAAVQRAQDLARELNAELEALIAREVRRPYFHYQNLIHDPQTSAGLSVSPSPLARGSEDKLVLGYFQLDARGRATTPTINDEVPKLSEPERIAAHREFRDSVVRDLSRHLAPPASATGPRLADVGQAPRPPRPQPRLEATPPRQQALVIQVDPNVYAQNINPNAVYSQQAQVTQRMIQQLPQVATSERPIATPAPVTITISPLEWRTLPFAGEPSLLAIRQVQTPDGALAQGFVVDRSTLTRWLAAKAGDMVVELHPDELRGAAIAPGWSLAVTPDPRTLAQAADVANAVASEFLFRFVGIGSMAVLAAAFVLLLVMRAEKLARERSQFAAAAAHELRTPLAGLQLYGDMLAEGFGDPGKMREYARHMSEDAARLGRVVTNMLGFAQLERGDLSVDAQVGPFGELLHDLAERARPALARAGTVLEIDIAPALHARFDRDAVARIIGNLLDNAEKYARGAHDRAIRLEALQRGDVVEVSVEDRGPGIADSTKLFRAFSRGVRGDGPPGLGLGLALSMSLARAMGGELTYKPRDGGGARFVLQLPRE